MELSRAAVSNVSRGTQTLDREPASCELEALIAEGLGALGIEVPRNAAEQLGRLSELLHLWATRINLTGHRDPETIARRLVLDAAALDPLLPRITCVADVGSGAGFPGLPLAILRPDVRLTSIEPRARRVYFQRAAVRELGLTNVTILQGRSEELDTSPHDLVIAQALARPASALEWMLPWSGSGGWIAIPTGIDIELAELERDPRLRDATSIGYAAPLGGNAHQLFLARLAN